MVPCRVWKKPKGAAVNRRELVNKVALQADITNKEADQILKAFQDVVTAYEAGRVGDALSLLGQRSFDAIVLDIVMPGTDGLTFLRGLKVSNKLANIPVVMLTAKDDIEDELQAMAGGAVRYIVKPSHRDVLVQTVESVLKQAQKGHPSQGP